MKHKYLVLISILCGMAFLPFAQGNSRPYFSGKVKVTSLAWSSDGNNLYYVAKRDEDAKHYAVALALTALIDDSYVARDVFVVNTREASVRNQLGSVGKLGNFAWSPDGKRIAYIAGEDINDPSPGRLYATSFRGGERTEMNYYLTGPGDALPPYEIDHAARLEK